MGARNQRAAGHSQRRGGVGSRGLALAGPACLLASAACGATPATWLNPVDGNWADGSKWSIAPAFPHQPANSTDVYDVTLAAGPDPFTVTVAQELRVNSLALASNATLAL